ncbi:aminopeptidase P family protein [Galbibacter pacificus]|uniref:Xaa-Pro aminopeptidase n=1 Tax=Galbibacter pacificus TaxID=2996052 RepID=A0ABT6FWG3_9FLAO|nr:aminopeptidase P family protein [Galbibacter pacificus]MDG3583953.1 aminopeptidase P family protein [Galbibacter pacificus]MDG3587609.1 aminopeptidase P family protein [Galbibacter pacificus]
MFSQEVYIARRATLKSNLKKGVLLFPGNGESGMNCKDNWYPFRQDSTFLYYTGINIPDVYFVIDIENDEEILFGNNPTPEEIVWIGAVTPLEELAAKAGIKTVRPLKELASYVQKAQQREAVHYLPPYRPATVVQICQFLNIPVSEVEKKCSVPFIKAVVAQREIKEAIEVEQIHKAVNTTAAMHTYAMQNAVAGKTEKEIAGDLQAIAIGGGGNISFPIILTTNGQYLHNHATENKIKNGNLVLCDCGAETSMGYAGDMTRTFPSAARFTDLQKEVYNIVLYAHNSAIETLEPGVRFKDVHLLAASKLVEGLKGMGLMKGNTDEAVHAGAHTLFFQCGLGHMMGLDVHDMENLGEPYVGYTDSLEKSTVFGLKSLRLGKELQEGFVITVEPGIYFNPFLIDAWKAQNKYADFVNYAAVEKFKDFGGIRIEEDFLITKNGSKLLGNPLAKTVDDVEALKNAI